MNNNWNRSFNRGTKCETLSRLEFEYQYKFIFLKENYSLFLLNDLFRDIITVLSLSIKFLNFIIAYLRFKY